ncbi:MAG: DNRLRE domain-containing protein [Dysgonamonadaceae bacterium]|jgi:hypothetical protein|nr:DNRLRE domain-containing protein [Dysgonamonadaceae bacterium]
MKTKKLFLGIALAIAMLPSLSNADSRTLTADRDNTIYYNHDEESYSDSLSNGSGGSFVAGTVNTPNYYRRALIHFDLSRLAGGTVDSVVLKIHAQQNARHDETARHFTLHKLNQEWKQGDSEAADPGRGTQAQTNDATWKWSVYPNSLWTTEGGNFVETASATTGTLTDDLLDVDVFWRSSVSVNEQMKTDVQNWINNPSTNFGWLIKGIEGTDLRKATMFYSRESANKPTLTVYYH